MGRGSAYTEGASLGATLKDNTNCLRREVLAEILKITVQVPGGGRIFVVALCWVKSAAYSNFVA